VSARDTVVPLLALDGTADCPLSGRDFLCFWPGRICNIIRFDEVYSALTQYNNKQFLSGPVRLLDWIFYFLSIFGADTVVYSLRGEEALIRPFSIFGQDTKRSLYGECRLLSCPFIFRGWRFTVTSTGRKPMPSPQILAGCEVNTSTGRPVLCHPAAIFRTGTRSQILYGEDNGFLPVREKYLNYIYGCGWQKRKTGVGT